MRLAAAWAWVAMIRHQAREHFPLAIAADWHNKKNDVDLPFALYMALH
jgi:hypothetical protein